MTKTLLRNPLQAALLIVVTYALSMVRNYIASSASRRNNRQRTASNDNVNDARQKQHQRRRSSGIDYSSTKYPTNFWSASYLTQNGHNTMSCMLLWQAMKHPGTRGFEELSINRNFAFVMFKWIKFKSNRTLVTMCWRSTVTYPTWGNLSYSVVPPDNVSVHLW